MKINDKRLWSIILLGISVVILLSLYYLRVGNEINLGLDNLFENIFLLPLKEILENSWLVAVIASSFIIISASKQSDNNRKQNKAKIHQEIIEK